MDEGVFNISWRCDSLILLHQVWWWCMKSERERDKSRHIFLCVCLCCNGNCSTADSWMCLSAAHERVIFSVQSLRLLPRHIHTEGPNKADVVLRSFKNKYFDTLGLVFHLSVELNAWIWILNITWSLIYLQYVQRFHSLLVHSYL